MHSPLWLFTLIPWAAPVLGAIAAVARTWCPSVTRRVQHLAAGVVFAATDNGGAALQHTGSTPAILVGGFLGLTAMFGVKEIGKRYSASWSLIVLVPVDILIDGAVLGIGFAAGKAQGTILATALTAEILFLGGVRRRNFAR